MATIIPDQNHPNGMCPVQTEGQLEDGRYFYFRSRHETARLGWGATPEEAIENTAKTHPHISRDLSHLGPSQAGYIDVEHAQRLLVEMAAEIPPRDIQERV